MNILITNPGKDRLDYALWKSGEGIRVTESAPDYRGAESGNWIVPQIGEWLAIKSEIEDPERPFDAIAIRVINGGNLFDRPVLYTDEARGKLESIIALSPLHIPAVIRFAESCRTVYPATPVFLFFETAFFSKLPARERKYAISPNIIPGYDIERRGYHGLLHESSCRMASRNFRACGNDDPARVMSICLDTRSEASAVFGFRPLTVTAGVTPLEGLMGDRSCGDIDPDILVRIAEHYHYGPEQIDRIVTEESGLTALMDRPVTLPEVFADPSPEATAAREVYYYKLLQACGAGLAAVGPFDYIVFSGRYCDVGHALGPRLAERIGLMTGGDPAVRVLFNPAGVMEVIAESAQVELNEYLTDLESSIQLG